MTSNNPFPLPVLVVDDDNALLRTVADILELNGYTARTADTGSGGLAVAAEAAPAVALVDLRLPDMNGLDVAARLHSLSDLTQVVVLTGNASLESAVAAMRERSIDYLVKPVNVEHLLKVVEFAGERWQRLHAEAALRSAANTLELRVRQQAAVAGLGERAFRSNHAREVFDDAVVTVAQTLDLDVVALVELNPKQDRFVVSAEKGWPTSVAADISADSDTLAGRAVLRSTAVDLNEERAGLTGAELDRRMASGLALPIAGPHRPFGALLVYVENARVFTVDDLHFLQAVIHIVGNIIEREQREAAFRQTQRLEAVGRLAGGIAHDFNNLLTAITGYSRLILDDLPDDNDLRPDIEEIYGAAQRAAGLTRKLLAFSRQQVLMPEILDVNETVRQMENMLRRLIGEHIELATNLSPDIGTIKADPSSLEQVLMNLVVNARDALPDGGLIIVETANVHLDGGYAAEQLSLESGDYVMLAVTDNGTGMDRETQQRIFEPFFTTKGADRGSGLGLATVYGIVKQSGGNIWVYSELGHGTAFKVYFPRLHDEVAQRAAPVARIPLRGTGTLLLVEDDDTLRKFATRVLSEAGYDVLVATHGNEALQIAQTYTKKIDLLITDVVMPYLSGPELALRVAEIRPETAVVYLSGYTDSVMLRKGIHDGSAAFIQKPFTAESLLGKIRELSERKHDA